MRTAIIAAIFSLSLASVASAQDAPAPCGPAGQLPDGLSTNVDADSRCFEIRMYTADTARDGGGDYDHAIDELHQRFREKEAEIFETHGAEIVGVWQNLDDPNTLVWMLAYRDRAHREEVWEAFRADPEWTALRAKYPVPVSANVFMLSASDYSNLK